MREILCGAPGPVRLIIGLRLGEQSVASSGCGCHTRFVKSNAAILRARDNARVRSMTVEERLALAFRLGDEDLTSFRATHGLDRPTAIRLLERRRQATRRPSACMERIIG